MKASLAEGSVTLLAVRKRLLWLFICFLVVSCALLGRLAWIQIVRADELYTKAWEQWNRSIPVRSPRGSIYDRYGKLLAGSSTVETVVAIPPQIEEPRETARLLAPVLQMDEDDLYELLTMDRSAIYLKRKVDPQVAQEVRELDLEGSPLPPRGSAIIREAGWLPSCWVL